MKISCPNCGQKYDADDSIVGQTAECGKCGEEFVVHDFSKLPEYPKNTQPFIRETKICPMCGETILAVAKKCRYCGTVFGDIQVKGEYSHVAYILLGLFLGNLGVHNFYVGRNGAACFNIVLLFLSFPSFGITALANFVFIISDICCDPNNEEVREKWKKNDNQYFWMSVFLFAVFMFLLLSGIAYKYFRSILE